MIADRLYQESKKNYGVCVGLDTDISYLPPSLQKTDASETEKIFLFNKMIIDATYDVCACYKVQIAYYEALGIQGLQAYAETLRYIKSKEKISIADIKRGDISATATKYAQGHFEGEFEADYLTLNAYMGEDAISPFYPYFKNGEKGAFILVKTSNPSGVDFQNKEVDNGLLYESVAAKVSEWGKPYIDTCGFSSVGAVIGLTYPEEINQVKKIMPNTFFLIPGYGAQGGTGKDIAKLFEEDVCGVVNSSRGIIASHIKKGIDQGFDEETRKCVMNMREDIGQWL